MSYTTLTEDFIQELYLRIGIIIPTQLDYQSFAQQLGIRIYFWEDKSQALFLNERSFIFLNKQLTERQRWQDFCHELAHVLLHTGHQSHMSPLFREYQENKANNFMYHACVPSFMLDEIDPDNLTVEYVQQQFKVEYDFALKRLDQYNSKKLYSEME